MKPRHLLFAAAIALTLATQSGSAAPTAVGTKEKAASGGTTVDHPAVSLTAVPEPGALISILGGCGILLGLRRRRF